MKKIIKGLKNKVEKMSQKVIQVDKERDSCNRYNI